MITLKDITINNFLSHEKTYISFNEDEKLLIDGNSGAGKSSIFDAIIWALYGEGRSDNKSMVRRGASKASVTLGVIQSTGGVGGTSTTYFITRTASNSGKHSVEVASEKIDGSREAVPVSGVREIQAWIDRELIGASYLLFVNSVAYIQGNSENFVVQSATKRKELLLEIVKAEDYKKEYEKTRSKFQEIENERAHKAGKFFELEKRLDVLKTRFVDRNTLYIYIADLEGRLAKEIQPTLNDLEKKSEDIRVAVQSATVLRNLVGPMEVEINTTKQKIKEKKDLIVMKEALSLVVLALPGLEKNITEIKATLSDLHAELEGATKVQEQRNEYFKSKPVIVDVSEDVKNLEGMIKMLKEQNNCPSGDNCPFQANSLESIKTYRERIDSMAIRTLQSAKDLTEWEEKGKSIPDEVDMKNILSKISEFNLVLQEKEKEMNSIKLKEKDLQDIAKAELELPILESLLTEKEKQYDDTLKSLKDAEDSLDPNMEESVKFLLSKAKQEAQQINDEISKSKATIEAMNKDEQESKEVETEMIEIKDKMNVLSEQSRKLSLLKDAFGSKGIEPMVIDLLLPKLEDKINDVLSKLSDFRVRLDTQTTKADGEGTKEGLWITIINEVGEEMDFNSYSGGERIRIMAAIQEALASLQKASFRLIDELVVGLDEVMVDSFTDVLQQLQSNFKQVFMISHLEGVKSLFDKTITVKKTKGISSVLI